MVLAITLNGGENGGVTYGGFRKWGYPTKQQRMQVLVQGKSHLEVDDGSTSISGNLHIYLIS